VMGTSSIPSAPVVLIAGLRVSTRTTRLAQARVQASATRWARDVGYHRRFGLNSKEPSLPKGRPPGSAKPALRAPSSPPSIWSL
jgi:hypothetical protein